MISEWLAAILGMFSTIILVSMLASASVSYPVVPCAIQVAAAVAHEKEFCRRAHQKYDERLRMKRECERRMQIQWDLGR